jgi:hypothetical protein
MKNCTRKPPVTKRLLKKAAILEERSEKDQNCQASKHTLTGFPRSGHKLFDCYGKGQLPSFARVRSTLGISCEL